jgi:anaerobic selenocysteine-containing dehydrogenase
MQVQTSCRCCTAGCGILVTVEQDRIVDIKGDKDNPRTHGYICPKGHALDYFHHRPDRLNFPLVDGVRKNWSECLDHLAGKLRALIAEHGPDSIGVYQGTGASLDSLGLPLIESFIRKIGSKQHYTAATVDVSPGWRAADMVTGSWFLCPAWVPNDPENRLVVYLGSNPAVSNGYGTTLPDAQRRIRAFRKRGGRLWVIDPQRTQTAALADRHLAIRPGSDAVLLAWLTRELLASNNAGADHQDYARMTDAGERARLLQALQPFTIDIASTATDLEPSALTELLEAVRSVGRLAVVVGTGIMFGPRALLTEWLRWVLLIVTGSLDRPGGMWFNPGWLNPLDQQTQWSHSPAEGLIGPGPKSRPDLPSVFGQRPAIALVDEIEAGHLKALLVFGSNPVTAFPNPPRTEAALRSLDVLATLDVLHSPLTAMSSHVLPSVAQLERADVVVEISTSFAPPAVPAAHERRPMWWIIRELGRRLGVDVLEGLDPEAVSDEQVIRHVTAHGRDGSDALIAAGTAGFASPRVYGWVRKNALPEGRWRLTPPDMLDRLAGLLADGQALGGTRRASSRDATTSGGPESTQNPQDRQGLDASLLLISTRQLSRINSTRYVSPRISRDLPCVRVSPDDAAHRGLRDGDRAQISNDFGKISAAVRIDKHLRAGVISMPHGWPEANVCHLTSSTHGLDPLTAQPQMTALPVSLTRG